MAAPGAGAGNGLRSIKMGPVLWTGPTGPDSENGPAKSILEQTRGFGQLGDPRRQAWGGCGRQPASEKAQRPERCTRSRTLPCLVLLLMLLCIGGPALPRCKDLTLNAVNVKYPHITQRI